MLNESSKLRTYRLLKNDYFKEQYLSVNMPGKYKSSFAKIRYEVAPLKIETGRYEGVSIENRTCFNNICNVNNGIENENHVLLECPEHADLRCYLFEHACFYNNNFMQLSDDEKCVFLFSGENMCFYSAKICHDILFKRKYFISMNC
jgi:hypothetical protein